MATKSTAKSETPKKRGAPKGVKRGPRPTLFCVQGQKKGADPFMDLIPAKSEEEADKKFQEIHKTKPIGKILGPLYVKQGGNATKSASFDVQKLRLTGISKFGNWRGWICKVLMDEDPTKCFVIPAQPVDPNDESKNLRSQPKPKPIALSEVENLRDSM